MGNKIICIARQFGSGGHEIAVRTAERLHIRVYEKDIFRLACKYGEVPERALEAADETATNPFLFQTVHEGNYHVARGLPTSEVLYALQSHEIKRLAKNESCVFVGRCADFVLKDEDAALYKIFVSAPFDRRVERKAEQEHLSREKAARLVRRMDRRRKKYCERYTGRPWGPSEYYDLCLDTGEISLEEAVERICALYEKG